MAINLQAPDIRELKPHITVFGIGGAGGNAVNNMIESGLLGVDFVVANTDAQALASTKAQRIIQMGLQVTQGLGAGAQPEIGRAAAEEVIDEIRDQLSGVHMVFVTAGMGGGTGSGAAPVIARTARELGILTVGVVTKPFQFEGRRRMLVADAGIEELQAAVDTLIVIPNQNLFRIVNEKTGFADAFAMADRVLYSGVSCITDLMVKEGMINLDFADVRSVMRGMGKAMMGTGEASGENRALLAAEAAIANPLLDETSMKGSRGLLISITGGPDMTLYEVDEAATRIREEVDEDANIIFGATRDDSMEGSFRVSVVATGIDPSMIDTQQPPVLSNEQRVSEVAERLRAEARARAAQTQPQPQPQAFQPRPLQAAQAPLVVNTPAAPVDYAASIEVAPQPEAQPAPQAYAPPPVMQQPAPQMPLPPLVHGNVQMTPAQPRMASAYEAAAPAFQHAPMPEEIDLPENFIPPQAERAIIRPTRMPSMDELPMPAQNQLRARDGNGGEQHHEQHKRLSLLQRLTTVGFGRRDEQDAGPVDHEMPQQPMQRHEPVMGVPPVAPVHAEYSRRPAQLEPAPQQAYEAPRPATPRIAEEDQLEIPAFLRRQAN